MGRFDATPTPAELAARLRQATAGLGPAVVGVPGERSASDGPPTEPTLPEGAIDPTKLRLAVTKKPTQGLHLLVLAGCIAVALFFAVFQVTRSRAQTVPVVPPPVVTPAASRPPPTPTPVMIRVHVIGEVVAPGVSSLTDGSRVEDAIAAAGGLTPAARPGQLNLAALVSDGAQIVVGGAGEEGSAINEGGDAGVGASGASGPSGKVDLNRASAAQLDTLPGVGPVMVAKIIERRPFTRIEELQEIDGVGAKTFERLAPYVKV